MLAVTVVFEIHESHVDAFRVAVLQHAKNSITHESACRRFDVSIDPENRQRFFLYEMYDDVAAFAVHQQADYFGKFAATIEPWVVSKDINVWQLESPPAAAPA